MRANKQKTAHISAALLRFCSKLCAALRAIKINNLLLLLLLLVVSIQAMLSAHLYWPYGL